MQNTEYRMHNSNAVIYDELPYFKELLYVFTCLRNNVILLFFCGLQEGFINDFLASFCKNRIELSYTCHMYNLMIYTHSLMLV
jgi:hypothetical protein